MSDRDRLIEAGPGWLRPGTVGTVLDALTATPELAGVLARWAAEQAGGEYRPPRGRRITHGRHCTCSACAAEDWTNPKFAPCGMHGASCPAVYAPLGAAGEDRVSE